MQTMSSTQSTSTPNRFDDHDFDALAKVVSNRFAMLGGPLFHTDAGQGLYKLFLDCLPASQRQGHTCNACRHFIERFGDLVVINQDGSIASAFWDVNAPAPYNDAIEAMAREVERSRVIGVFLSSERVLGTPLTGEWHHFGVTQKKPFVAVIENAHQVMASKR